MSTQELTREINKVIKPSVKFEEYMDSTDFDSYFLESDEEREIKRTPGFIKYLENIENASKEIYKGISCANDSELVELIYKAKGIRLEARKQTNRKKEEEKYIDALFELNKAFTKLDPQDLKSSAGTSIYENGNWQKVLLYNEMAVCYSGLEDTSIALGYAERSIALLKKIYSNEVFPKKASKTVKLLYTFALYNKGESERLLENYEDSLRTFTEIRKIYDDLNGWNGKKPSDYYSALLKIAIILIDLGRGKEALKCLEKIKETGDEDYRKQECLLEEARAKIDMKNYEEAYEIIEKFLTKSTYTYTFSRRKAKVSEWRLLSEFKKNRAKDYSELAKHRISSDFYQKISCRIQSIEEDILPFLTETVRRRDGDSFKKACLNYSTYFQQAEAWERALRGYFLYLLHRDFFEKGDYEEKGSYKEKETKIEDGIKYWLIASPIDLQDNDRQAEVFIDIINKTNTEEYLQGFFETYLNYYDKKEIKPTKNVQKIIRAIKNRLLFLYGQQENLIQSQKIEEAYNLFSAKSVGKHELPEQKDAEKFVTESFFKGHLYSKASEKNDLLRADSILGIMNQNTFEFAKRIVKKSCYLENNSGHFQAVFTVLRRWNSFTPTLTSTINPSKGGGYFLYISYAGTSLGIVLDPGYNFLENFFSMGFNIKDINYIIVSHAHPDHNDNLPQILSLFHEANSRLGKNYFKNEDQNQNNLTLILSEGVFNQFYNGFIKPNQTSLEDIVVIKTQDKKSEIEKIIVPEFKGKEIFALEIQPIPTGHKDITNTSESFGFIFEIKKNGHCWRKIGYTSDAHWSKKFHEQFQSCNIICAHLGSIIDVLKNKDFCTLCCNDAQNCSDCKLNRFENGEAKTEKLLKQAREQNHLYLSGLVLFFDKLLPLENGENNLELAVISEFGEELKGGIRMDLYKKFNDWFESRSNSKATCIPGDIGLEIDLTNSAVYCYSCQKFKPRNEMSPIPYGKEEAICYVCNECKGVFSTYQIGEKLKRYCENGKKLE